MRTFRTNSPPRKGTVAPMLAVTAIGMISFMALAIDIGLLLVARTECQNAADSAALAACRQLDNKPTSVENNRANAELTARRVLRGNQFLNSPLSDVNFSNMAAPVLRDANNQPILDPDTNQPMRPPTYRVGLYDYNTTTQRFEAQFPATRPANRAWTCVQVTVSGSPTTYFANIMGITTMTASTRALAVHRPRDIALVLDFSGSMRFGSLFNWCTAVRPSDTAERDKGGGMLSPDPLYPRFGHYSRYDAYTTTVNPTGTLMQSASPGGRPNPLYTKAGYVNSTGELMAPNNVSITTPGGQPMIRDFYYDPANESDPTSLTSTVRPTFLKNAFHRWSPAETDGDPTQYVSQTYNFANYNATGVNGPTPAPQDFVTQSGSASPGDKAPRKRGQASGTSWSVGSGDGVAFTLAEMLGWTAPLSYDVAATVRTDYTTVANNGGNWQRLPPWNTSLAPNTAAPSTVNFTNPPSSVSPRPNARTWDNFRDATWERYGYDLDVAHYYTNRPANWEARWDWDIDTSTWAHASGGVEPTSAVTFRPRRRTDGTFQGYTMGPGYWGKTFFMWPPDPRRPVGEVGDTNFVAGDWRERYFNWTPPRPTTPPGTANTGYQWQFSEDLSSTTGDMQFRNGTWNQVVDNNYRPPQPSGLQTGYQWQWSGPAWANGGQWVQVADPNYRPAFPPGLQTGYTWAWSGPAWVNGGQWTQVVDGNYRPGFPYTAGAGYTWQWSGPAWVNGGQWNLVVDGNYRPAQPGGLQTGYRWTWSGPAFVNGGQWVQSADPNYRPPQPSGLQTGYQWNWNGVPWVNGGQWVQGINYNYRPAQPYSPPSGYSWTWSGGAYVQGGQWTLTQDPPPPIPPRPPDNTSNVPAPKVFGDVKPELPAPSTLPRDIQPDREDGTFYASTLLQTTTGTPYAHPSQWTNLNRKIFRNSAGHPLNIAGASTSEWSAQVNYPAILRWLRSPPMTLPPNLRSGRVVYYTSIPTNLTISGSDSTDLQRDKLFWREYIDYVLGLNSTGSGQVQAHLAGREDANWPEVTDSNGANPRRIEHRVNQTATLGRHDANRNSSTNALDPMPYMGYNDNPPRPRLHFWFGPMSMMAFLGNYRENMFSGTVREAQSWQLKAAVSSAMDDIRNNHPNDAIGMAFFSYNTDRPDTGYGTIAAAIGQDFNRIRNALFYPLSMLTPNNQGVAPIDNLANEYRPYDGSMNYLGLSNIPNSQKGTDPNTGMAMAFNLLAPSTFVNSDPTRRGRRSAAKIVIFETDGVPNAYRDLTYDQLGSNSYYRVTGNGANGGNGNTDAQNAGLAVVDRIVSPFNNTSSGVSGHSTPNTPARVYAVGFGDLFDTPTATFRDSAISFLLNVQKRGNTSPATLSTFPPEQLITGPYQDVGSTQGRLTKLRIAFERILQSGVQVTLVE
jgi:hypothetical protein